MIAGCLVIHVEKIGAITRLMCTSLEVDGFVYKNSKGNIPVDSISFYLVRHCGCLVLTVGN